MTTRTRKGKAEWCKTDLSQILSRFTKSELVAMWRKAREQRERRTCARTYDWLGPDITVLEHPGWGDPPKTRKAKPRSRSHD
jgi:hypothetical protein